MTRLEWGIVIVAVGAGIVSQIPNHDDMDMAGHEHTAPAVEVAAGMQVTTLSITGMT